MISIRTQEILVLAPHPDDETFGCGGTIRMIVQSGGQVDVVFMTRGELGCEAPATSDELAQRELAQVRTHEAQEACRLLGVRDVFFLDGRDGRLASQPELVAPLRRVLQERPYRRVFCPWWGDSHEDHRATCQLLEMALKEAAMSMEVWLYEVWTPLEPNMSITIDDTMEAKRAAIGVYRSQQTCLDYHTAFEGLASYRALRCPPSQYVETFLVRSSNGHPAAR